MSNGDCFIVLPENCASGSLIVGRNAEDADGQLLGMSTEICYYDPDEVLTGKTDGGAKVETASDTFRVILQKPKLGLWGGDFGANDQGLAVGLTWSSGDAEAKDSDSLLATDLVRLALALCSTAEAAVERLGLMVSSYSQDSFKFNFIVCDSSSGWLVSCSGKLWAAEKVEAPFLRVPSGGLTVGSKIAKSTESLNVDDNFASSQDAEAQAPPEEWCGPKPLADKSYTHYNMFETLRAASRGSSSRGANVSVLNLKSISCHWFTATPNAAESVFKPFVFAPNPKISPLTQVQPEAELTLLHKLHNQKKPAALEHLRSLERSCVDELNNYFSLQDHPSEELDELLKDCVEAEVKFYR
ncbi:uncharacterized protein Dwil_GK11840 [Drosophila willistoni]|uniref:Uncharacterized protein n=1 Tax=Drosophila willistoni TaxID=7260 RepID=B4NB72_DROWI|nr:secernin-3 [Drosophila willistoni]EDW81036.1 uncharacterized protein Dwil_GK11840 [Drosophila willistoni]